MMQARRSLIGIVSTSLAVVPMLAFAHSGKTDASGCHMEKKTGEYHCHSAPLLPLKTAKTKAKTSAKTTAKSGGGTICAANIYNCTDFPTHAAAQAALTQCLKQTGRDVHGLDGDHDGIACESLP